MTDQPIIPGSGKDPTPPLTKRGCLTPTNTTCASETQVVFHLDYLKITVFALLHEVFQAIELGLYDPAGVTCDQWVDRGPGKRWASIYDGPGHISVLVPKDDRQGYCLVELKGEACALFSSERLQGFMRYLTDTGLRWHCTRIDPAFDHVLFTPYLVHDAIERRDFNSRCLKYEDRDWNVNHEGATAYLGKRRQRKDRMLRVYNMRGYNRCEGEFSGPWARTAGRALERTPVDQWPVLGVELIRGMVDFVDSTASERIERCPLLPWWNDFVGDAGKIRQLDDEDRRKKLEDDRQTAIGKSEQRIKRAALSLWPILEAYGDQYLTTRIRYYAEGRIRQEDEQFREQLEPWKYSGFAGLPKGVPDDDVPF
ncbi:hypothetical protein HED60_23740 [Planctomycetales bacterium ZRK34]|nr:hypothetical protein HED60_23740 [Planctomycetales bacterium ZRK34]